MSGIGHQVYFRALNRQFQKGSEEQKGMIEDQQNGVDFTDNQRYFIAKLEAALQYTYDNCKDIENESMVVEAGKKIVFTAATYATTKLIAGLIPSKEAGDILTCAATGLTALYAFKDLKDNKIPAQKQAAKFTKFLGNSKEKVAESKEKNMSLDFVTVLACDLYLEYRIAIELLAKSTEGIDVLIKFFVVRIQEIIANIPNETLQKLDGNVDGKIEYLKERLVLGEISKDPLKLRGAKELEWNLQGLLTRAPIVVWSQVGASDCYKSTIYACTDSVKNAKVIGFEFKQEENSDGSYKYPCMIRFTRGGAALATGYQAQGSLERYYVIPDNTQGKPTGSFSNKIQEYYNHLVPFYISIRATSKNSKNKQYFIHALDNFLLLSKMLIAMPCTANLEWQHKFVEMEQLRNIFWRVLKPIFNVQKDPKHPDRAPKQWQECCDYVEKMNNLYSNDERVRQQQDVQHRVQTYFYSRRGHVVQGKSSAAVTRRRNEEFLASLKSPEYQQQLLEQFLPAATL